MTKIGVFSDVHGNLPALEAALAALQKQGCEEYLCAGDLVGIGPCPEEVTARLRQLPKLTCVRGNHEGYVLSPLTVPYPDGMDEEEAEQHRWEREHLSQESLDFLRGLPRAMSVMREGVRISVAHYALREPDGFCPLEEPNPQRLDELFADARGTVVLYGHHHEGHLDQSKKRLYINPGALGCLPPEGVFARCGILRLGNGSCTYEPLQVPYDVGETVASARIREYPNWEKIDRWFYRIEG